MDKKRRKKKAHKKIIDDVAFGSGEIGGVTPDKGSEAEDNEVTDDVTTRASVTTTYFSSALWAFLLFSIQSLYCVLEQCSSASICLAWLPERKTLT